MSIARIVLVPVVLLLALVGCDGTLSNIWDAFPSGSFSDGDGDGDGGGTPTTPAATEIFGLEATHGVSGDVRNLKLVQIPSGPKLALLSAGPAGVHVVDVTDPGQVSAASYIGTISDARLASVEASIAGDRVDALTVIDSQWLVCVAIGTSAENAVTVFNVKTAYEKLVAGEDLSPAFVAPSPDSAIAVPGADGKAGGVAGSGSLFLVATGGAEMALATIDPATTPPTWTAHAAFQDPQVDEFLDVLYQSSGGTGIFYASVRSGTDYGIVVGGVAVADPPLTTLTSPVSPIQQERFATIINDRISGPGNYPLDLAFDLQSLYVAGDNEVVAFNVTNPTSPQTESTITATGTETIALSANSGAVAVGAKDAVRIYSALGGTRTLVSETFYEGTFTIRGVELVFSSTKSYVLACAGTRGLRVLEWVALPTTNFGGLPG